MSRFSNSSLAYEVFQRYLTDLVESPGLGPRIAQLDLEVSFELTDPTLSFLLRCRTPTPTVDDIHQSENPEVTVVATCDALDAVFGGVLPAWAPLNEGGMAVRGTSAAIAPVWDYIAFAGAPHYAEIANDVAGVA